MKKYLISGLALAALITSATATAGNNGYYGNHGGGNHGGHTGGGNHGGGNHGGGSTNVPEPGALSLVGLGLLSSIVLRRRRKTT